MTKDTMNHHCSVVQVEGLGILIQGASGSGKSFLAMGLMDIAKARGLAATFVCDDQALLHVSDEKLMAEAPQAILGKVEIRGFGISNIEYIERTQIDLVCNLVPDEQIDRMPDAKDTELLGAKLPLIEVPQRHETQAVRIVLAYIAESVQ